MNEIESIGKNLRLVVMLETRPLSDQYEQVKITHVQFKELSELVYRMQKPIGEHVMVTTVGDPVQIPNVQQYV